MDAVRISYNEQTLRMNVADANDGVAKFRRLFAWMRHGNVATVVQGERRKDLDCHDERVPFGETLPQLMRIIRKAAEVFDTIEMTVMVRDVMRLYVGEMLIEWPESFFAAAEVQ